MSPKGEEECVLIGGPEGAVAVCVSERSEHDTRTRLGRDELLKDELEGVSRAGWVYRDITRQSRSHLIARGWVYAIRESVPVRIGEALVHGLIAIVIDPVANLDRLGRRLRCRRFS